MKIKLFLMMMLAALLSPGAMAEESVPAAPTTSVDDVKKEQYELRKKVNTLCSQVHKLQSKKPTPTTSITVENTPVDHIDIPSAFYFGATPILSAPYIGEQTYFNGAHLIVNLPSVNEDLRLLQFQQRLYNTYLNNKIPYPKNPFVQFSGKVEAQALASTPYSGNRTSDINLTGAELDMAAVLNRFAVSFLGFSYDSSAPSANNPPITRVTNSRVVLTKGFLSIGNLNKAPAYGTIGQFYVPFGLYASNMLSTPLTASVGEMLERAVLIGYSPGPQGPYGSVFTFKGDSGSGGTLGHINQVGVNAGLAKDFGKVKTDVGVGYIANIADSLGMQDNGQTSGFTGFGGSSATENLAHRVPAVDIRGNIAIDKYNLRAEYVDSIRSFASTDMSFNGRSARPGALNIEGSYSFMTYSHPSAVAVGYGNSSEALALLIPKQTYRAVYSMAAWQSTIATIEFRHDINYEASDYASGGGGLAVNTGSDLGHTSQTVTAQLGVYF